MSLWLRPSELEGVTEVTFKTKDFIAPLSWLELEACEVCFRQSLSPPPSIASTMSAGVRGRALPPKALAKSGNPNLAGYAQVGARPISKKAKEIAAGGSKDGASTQDILDAAAFRNKMQQLPLPPEPPASAPTASAQSDPPPVPKAMPGTARKRSRRGRSQPAWASAGDQEESTRNMDTWKKCERPECTRFVAVGSFSHCC